MVDIFIFIYCTFFQCCWETLLVCLSVYNSINVLSSLQFHSYFIPFFTLKSPSFLFFLISYSLFILFIFILEFIFQSFDCAQFPYCRRVAALVVEGGGLLVIEGGRQRDMAFIRKTKTKQIRIV